MGFQGIIGPTLYDSSGANVELPFEHLQGWASTHLNEHSIALIVRPSRNEALILEKPKTLEVPLKKARTWVFLKMIPIFPYDSHNPLIVPVDPAAPRGPQF